jgi:hypothetical protein
VAGPGWNLFEQMNDTNKSLGVGHEVYHVAKRHWEAVYNTCGPFGHRFVDTLFAEGLAFFSGW